METIRKPKTVNSKDDVAVNGDFLILKYLGKEYRFELEGISKRLAEASKAIRENFTVSPSGYGIHWPDIDEDLSINALLNSIIGV
jgi:hypothetical protein